ncbi:type-F conjugative transfer system pilin assembly protein TrbC [Sphingobium sp. B11D3A]|uniref:type-F conjugative transfer system pilin assembly protein TrbC n=1 Tax=Sphingobium sp. B11D3A TaxID=2940574 RepID=UPI00222590C7|nr:type-F conjugative transfer system pilin assembly protein TrbC [Sphingobium sp. B11D3A]
MDSLMRKSIIWVLSGAALLVAGYAVAQTVQGLDLQAITQRASGHAVDAQALADEVTRRSQSVREEALAVVEAGHANLGQNADALRGGIKGPIDFDAIVASAADPDQRGNAPQFIVFASLSMPADSLKPLIRDTTRAGGAVVFRGFPGNSMKAFQQGIAKVLEGRSDNVNVGIDPRLFRAFAVEAVPAFVVVTSDFDSCDGFDCKTDVPPFDKLSGNVTVSYALETMADGGGPGARVARTALSNLQRSGS